MSFFSCLLVSHTGKRMGLYNLDKGLAVTYKDQCCDFANCSSLLVYSMGLESTPSRYLMCCMVSG